MQASKEEIARLEGVTKVYRMGDNQITALEKTDVVFRKGELCLIIGPSGSGKTTLLSLLGCVIYPSEGRLYVAGQDIGILGSRELARLRLHTIGFVFQNFNLIAPLNALDNVMMPLQLQGIKASEARRRAMQALELVGMTDRKANLPGQLSGGQQQRVAIARALVTDPSLVLCDEPTASLDARSIGTVMKELRALSSQGKAVCVVTHDPRLIEYADRVLRVDEGRVTEETNLNQNFFH